MTSLQANISLFPSAMANRPIGDMPLAEFMDGVESGRWKEQVAPLRHLVSLSTKEGRDQYNAGKRHLPAVTLSCRCDSREKDLTSDDRGVVHSGWLQADFDLKDNPRLGEASAVAAMRGDLIEDPYVGAVFVGPSGEGIKAIVCIDPEKHRESWAAAEEHFRVVHQLKMDSSTKDPARLCFVSFDSLAEMSLNFSQIPCKELVRHEPNHTHIHLEATASDIEEMLAFIPSRPDYDTWLRVASAVWSALPMDEGYRLLCKWSPEEKENEYLSKYKSRLQQITVGTLAHMAKAGGFDPSAASKRRRWAGIIRFAPTGTTASLPESDDQEEPEVTLITLLRIKQAFDQGQIGDAEFWAENQKGKFAYNLHAKEWMIYSSGIWKKSLAKQVPKNISNFLIPAYQEMISKIKKEISDNPPSDPKKDSRGKEIEGITARIKLLQRWDYLAAVEKFATALLGIPATEFDNDPDLLVVADGVLDFKQMLRREFSPDDLATKLANVNFHPDATCPYWDAFLERIMPDQDTREYLARAAGYCLTGRCDYDNMFFAYGKGANGKSTFMGVLKMILGSQLMSTVNVEVLLSKKGDNSADYQKAAMQGMRVVLSEEIPANRSLSESVIKNLTGGDDIQARAPYQLPYDFKPTHKLWMMGNHKPIIKDVDGGIWRRIHMIPFLVTIPVEERKDRSLMTAEFQSELPGILNWAIKGLADLKQIGGLNPPDQVLDATAEYREESDQFGAWMNESTERDSAEVLRMGDLSENYSSWCLKNNEHPLYKGTRKLKAVMMDLGFKVIMDRKGHPCVLGIKIKEDQEPASLKFK